MSLSYHLENKASPVRLFLYSNFPNTLPVVRKANKVLRDAKTILPTAAAPELAEVRPADRIPYPYSDVGMAIDYRIRYYFATAESERLVAYTGACLLTHHYKRMPILLLDEFFESLDDFLLRLVPTRRRLLTEEESQLNRYCFVLALLEQARRMPPGRLDRSLLFLSGRRTTVRELLAIPKDSWLEDMQTLSWVFHEQFEHYLADTDFYLNSTFDGSGDIGGADADLILGKCLMDFKTTIDPRVQNRILYQLLGYALLDYSNKYELDEVGLYFIRQATTVRWPLAELLDSLYTDVTRPRLADLRERFRALLLEEVREDPSSRSRVRIPSLKSLIPPEWIA